MGIQSEINSVKCGVDIFNVSECLFTILYADDTCVLMNGKTLEDLVTRMQKELNLVDTWLHAN